MRRVYGTKVTRLTLGGLPSCPLVTGVLPASKGVGMGRQKSAEAVGAEPIGEGPNMTRRMEVWPFDGDERRR
jgi:hypothetical protein